MNADKRRFVGLSLRQLPFFAGLIEFALAPGHSMLLGTIRRSAFFGFHSVFPDVAAGGVEGGIFPMNHRYGKLTRGLVHNPGAGGPGDDSWLYRVIDPSGARRRIVRVTVRRQRNTQAAPLRTGFGLGGADIVTLPQSPRTSAGISPDGQAMPEPALCRNAAYPNIRGSGAAGTYLATSCLAERQTPATED